jgi:hypothetical protein
MYFSKNGPYEQYALERLLERAIFKNVPIRRNVQSCIQHLADQIAYKNDETVHKVASSRLKNRNDRSVSQVNEDNEKAKIADREQFPKEEVKVQQRRILKRSISKLGLLANVQVQVREGRMTAAVDQDRHLKIMKAKKTIGTRTLPARVAFYDDNKIYLFKEDLPKKVLKRLAEFKDLNNVKKGVHYIEGGIFESIEPIGLQVKPKAMLKHSFA